MSVCNERGREREVEWVCGMREEERERERGRMSVCQMQ
jgi:hypothetical protein